MQKLEKFILEHLEYDCTSPSFLRWKKRPSPKSSVRVGQVAGWLNKDTGYWYVKNRKAHRIIWFMFNRTWPKVIDHKDRNRQNNDIDNLRDVDSSVNNHNRTGSKGYSYIPSRGVYEVACQRYGKRLWAYCDTEEEAVAKYAEFKDELYGDIYG